MVLFKRYFSTIQSLSRHQLADCHGNGSDLVLRTGANSAARLFRRLWFRRLRREELGWGKRGIVDAAAFWWARTFAMPATWLRSSPPPGVPGGSLPQRSVIVGVGDPIPAAAKIEARTPPGVVATRQLAQRLRFEGTTSAAS